jgi:hypothetical protein
MLLLPHSNDTAGTLGAVFIVFGLVGAGCVGECTASLMDSSVLYLRYPYARLCICSVRKGGQLRSSC